MNRIAQIGLAVCTSLSFMASAQVAIKPEIKAEVKPGARVRPSGSEAISKSQEKTLGQFKNDLKKGQTKAPNCNASEFASELARRGNGDSARIERQMKLVGLGLGACNADKGGLLGKDATTGEPNYTDAQLQTLVKILNATEEALAKGMTLIEAEQAGYSAVTGADADLAKKAIDAFRNHCKIFANI